jgi:hypothetical protein
MTDSDFPRRTLPDGRVLMLYPLFFGRWRLGVSKDAKAREFEDEW